MILTVSWSCKWNKQHNDPLKILNATQQIPEIKNNAIKCRNGREAHWDKAWH